MQEQSPRHERITDDDIIRRGIEVAIEQDRLIDDTTARVIASRWHGGQASGLYSFASTGAIDHERTLCELVQNLREPETTDADKHELFYLTQYLIGTDERDPVIGWHEKTRWPNDGSEWTVRLYGQRDGDG